MAAPAPAGGAGEYIAPDDGSGAAPFDVIERCGCDRLLGDLVLAPYWVIFLSVLLLTALSLFLTMVELHWRQWREGSAEQAGGYAAAAEAQAAAVELEDLTPGGTSGPPKSLTQSFAADIPDPPQRRAASLSPAASPRTPGSPRAAVRSLAGAATLAALASPPWFLIFPQTLYHVAHFGYIVYQAAHQDVGYWGRYTLGFAEWVNGGAGIFLVFGTAGAWYTRRMIEGQQRAWLEVAEPASILGETVDADNFRKAYLAAANLHEIDALRDERRQQAAALGTHQEWEAGYRTRVQAGSVLAICLFPAMCTHILPGLVLWAWVFGPVLVSLHCATKFFIVRRSRRVGLVARIIALDAVLAVYSMAAQEAFNMALLFFEGEPYFHPLPRVLLQGRSTSCWLCAMGDSVGSVLHTLSFA
eukprot:TRINITY_DN29556_c0_g1_i1.p2 TRINITY_DN29556_c0_g1~~TRINITY_DN29556_c0_g1_i1.p2  ORF type:complete len:447 (+),score=131.84 TRINITY_DN29556_c0_g1_i1:98-1342(+)